MRDLGGNPKKSKQIIHKEQIKMKSRLLFLFLILTQTLFAQTFTDVSPASEFDGVGSSSIAFLDVNGDGHEDVLIMGLNNCNERITKLYTNDGMGNFSELTGTPFDGVSSSSIDFSDVNGDGHEDVLITGFDSSFEPIAKLYTNDGMGNFTELTGTPFDGVWDSSIAFSDVNGDGHEDVLITGLNSSGDRIAKLYTNDGMGNFTELTGTPFDGVSSSSIAFLDVNDDGHMDVLLTGLNSSNQRIAKLYTNDGMGNFTELTGTPFDGVWSSSIAFADVNGDGNVDVLITGQNSSDENIAKLYTNDGIGNFSELTGTPFDAVTFSSIAFADVNGDGHEDALITGQNSSDENIAKLYTNDGIGNFSELMGTPFDGVNSSSIAFADVNGDGHEDVLITGQNSSFASISKLYTNDGMGNFTELTGTPFDAVTFNSIAFADVNGDGHEDVLITGLNSSSERISKLYTNDGMSNFTELTGTPFDGVGFSSIAFADVNGDGHEDVLITGLNSSSELIAKLYTNDGMGNFTELTGTPFDGLSSSSIAFSDVNDDGHMDVLLTGLNSSNQRIAKLYTNDGMGNFTELTGTPFDGVSWGSIAFADVNGDGNVDVLITGQNSSDENIAKLYTNDGMGNFSELTGTPFDAVTFSSIAFSDVNGDGHEDVLITGFNNSLSGIAKLYTNDGMGNFTELTGTPFDGVRFSSIAFADVNGDGLEDVLITGLNSSGERISKLYTNDGMGNFSEMMDTPFDGVDQGSIAFADVNGDGHEDVFITGLNSSCEQIAKLYINDGMVSSMNELILGFNLDFTPYPNPTKSDMLNVRFDSSESGFSSIDIYDINGRLLVQQRAFVGTGAQTIFVDISSLSPGSYFIRLENGKRRGVAKLIVQ
jgi:signal peptidase I